MSAGYFVIYIQTKYMKNTCVRMFILFTESNIVIRSIRTLHNIHIYVNKAFYGAVPSFMSS